MSLLLLLSVAEVDRRPVDMVDVVSLLLMLSVVEVDGRPADTVDTVDTVPLLLLWSVSQVDGAPVDMGDLISLLLLLILSVVRCSLEEGLAGSRPKPRTTQVGPQLRSPCDLIALRQPASTNNCECDGRL
jgi:hypothetical protein